MWQIEIMPHKIILPFLGNKYFILWKQLIFLVQIPLSFSNLSQCHPVMLSVVISLITDDYKQIQEQSTSLIKKYQHQHQDAETTLCQLLQDNLFDLATKLPRLVRVSGKVDNFNSLYYNDMILCYLLSLNVVHICLTYFLFCLYE